VKAQAVFVSARDPAHPAVFTFRLGMNRCKTAEIIETITPPR